MLHAERLLKIGWLSSIWLNYSSGSLILAQYLEELHLDTL
jgi:hypothetical protein